MDTRSRMGDPGHFVCWVIEGKVLHIRKVLRAEQPYPTTTARTCAEPRRAGARVSVNIRTWGGRYVTRAELRFQTATSLVPFEQGPV